MQHSLTAWSRISFGSSLSLWIGIPSGYSLPASSGG